MKPMRLFFCAVAFLYVGAVSTRAEMFIHGSYVQFNGNWYGLDEWGPNDVQDFHGADLGTYLVGESLQMTDAEMHFVFIQFILYTDFQYQDGVSPDTEIFSLSNGEIPFVSYANGSSSGVNDMMMNNPHQILTLDTSTPGEFQVMIRPHMTYIDLVSGETIEVYGESGWNTATYTVLVPEPATIALLGLGCALLTVFRRRNSR
jgi:hypothetical protein